MIARVRELTELVDEPQNLVSYHLRQLRDGGLVVARRSSADGRDSYYAIDLARCQDELQTAGGALHPALWLVPAPPRRPTSAPRRRPRVLFLCTGNSARSQIAEALLEQHLRTERSTRRVRAAHPKPLHPNAVRVMRTRGIDISRNRTKHLDEFRTQRFDLVDHAVRPSTRGLPGVPVRTRGSCTGAFPIPRSKARRTACLLPGVRTHRRRARDPHPLPAPPAERRTTPKTTKITRRSTHAQPMTPSTCATWSTTSTRRSPSTRKVLDFELLTSAAPAFADVKRGNLRLLLSGPTSSAGRPMADGDEARTGRLEPHPLHRRRPRRRSRTPARRRRRSSATTSSKDPAASRSCSRTLSGNVVELFQPASR